MIHGTLVTVFDKGILIMGPSGSGKSESVIDLIKLNHLFVADDAVKIVSSKDKIRGMPIAKDFPLHIRGIGIVNVAETYGNASVKDSSEIDLVIELKQGENSADYDLLENSNNTELLGQKIKCLRLPALTHGKLAHLIELGVKQSFGVKNSPH